MSRSLSCVGPATSRLSQDYKDRAPDEHEFLQILQVNHLVAINTWALKDTAASAFKFGPHQAQLDYVILGQRGAKAQARQARTLHDCPLGGWRRTWGCHLLIIASVRARVVVPVRKPQNREPIDREAIIAFGNGCVACLMSAET